MPLTIGSSGPTKTNDILYFKLIFLISSKSFTSPERFSANNSVPPFPGKAKIFEHLLLFDMLLIIACSRPPEPITRIFI